MPDTVLGDRVGDKDAAVNKDQKKISAFRSLSSTSFFKKSTLLRCSLHAIKLDVHLDKIWYTITPM